MSRNRIHFKEEWLGSKDSNGDSLNEYITKGNSEFEAKCLWCKKSLAIDNQGKAQILQHSKGAGHKNVADNLKGRKVKQTTFMTQGEVSNEANNNLTKNQSLLKNFLVPSSATPLLSSVDKLTLSDKVIKAETLLVLKGV